MNVMKLDDVRVTKKTGDGGIDLIATEPIITERLSDDIINDNLYNTTNYKIQAKCWKPSRSIPPKEINQLRGAMSNNDRGLFIATCSYSKNALQIAKDDIKQHERPMFLIDGVMLVKLCMLNAFGFKYIPHIDKEQILVLINNPTKNPLNISLDDELKLNIVNKRITNNDVRARILRLPPEIKNQLDLSSKKIKVNINDTKVIDLTLDASRSYLAGITDIYRKYGLLLDSGETKSGIAKMFVDNDLLNIIINYE